MQTSVIHKKKEIADLGKAAKEMNLNMETDEGELNGYKYIRPSEKQRNYIGKSTDYIVFMHFPEQLKDSLLPTGGHYLTQPMLE